MFALSSPRNGLLLGVVSWSVIRDLILQVLLVALYVDRDRAALSTVPLPPQMIQANIGDDAVYQRRERAIEAEAA